LKPYLRLGVASDFLLLILIYYSSYSLSTPTTHSLLLLLIFYSYYSFTAPTACCHNLLRKESSSSRTKLHFSWCVEDMLYSNGSKTVEICWAISCWFGWGWLVWFGLDSFGLVLFGFGFFIGLEATRVCGMEEEKGGGLKPDLRLGCPSTASYERTKSPFF
jgi:hypothetical protein